MTTKPQKGPWKWDGRVFRHETGAIVYRAKGPGWLGYRPDGSHVGMFDHCAHARAAALKGKADGS